MTAKSKTTTKTGKTGAKATTVNTKSAEDAKDDVAKAVAEQVVKVEARLTERLNDLTVTIDYHKACIEKLEAKRQTITAYAEKRINTIKEKGDPRTKKLRQIQKLQERMAELQAEIEDDA